MKSLLEHECVAPHPPDGEAAHESSRPQARGVPQRRDRSRERLAHRVLARLPLSVAVIDEDANLSFWNEQAGPLFGVSPLAASEQPGLARILAQVRGLTQPQRDRIVAFARAHIEAGDRTEPDGCLRLSVGRASHIAIQIHGLGTGHWMLIFDDGKVTAAGNAISYSPGDAWLDSLIGLSNRRHFNQMLRQAIDC